MTSRRGPLVLLTLVSATLSSCNLTMDVITADFVLTNAAIWTGDSRRPQASALAVFGERILAVGDDEAIGRLRGPNTQVLNANGHLVVPGFNDSHVHFATGGRNLLSVKLRNAATPEEFAQRIGEYAQKQPKGEWILGGDWDHELWPGSPLPTRRLIDPVAPDNPVFVNRLDGHMSLANSVALRLAGITRSTTDPDGGTIVRDGSGEPTGILKDAAAGLVERVIPEPTAEKVRRSIEAALAEARRCGVTSIQDMSSPADLAVYQELLRSGALTARISSRSPLEERRNLSSSGIQAAFGGTWLRLGSLKAFADGSLGSTTALFFAPYDDAPGTCGLPAPAMFPPSNMLRLIREADAQHLQVSVHAIGDKANHLILNMYEEVASSSPRWDRRFRIEHAQHLQPSDIPRFGSLGVIAAMQPYHAIDDGRWAEKRIGRERCRTTYAFRSLLNAGARIAFGSDWYVAPLNPLLGIYAAVTRRTLDGGNPGGWYPEQKITVAEALQAYTSGSAYAEFQENEKGTLAAGKLADFAVLSEDIFSIPPQRIEAVEVLYTVVGGKIVYRK